MELDGVPVSALINTGSQLSVMSAHVCRRIREVLTPASSTGIHVTDVNTSCVLGMYTASELR